MEAEVSQLLATTPLVQRTLLLEGLGLEGLVAQAGLAVPCESVPTTAVLHPRYPCQMTSLQLMVHMALWLSGFGLRYEVLVGNAPW